MKTLSFVFSLALFITTVVQPSVVFAQECEIGEIQTTVHDCDSNGFFEVELDFDYANVGEEGFVVKGNGNNYGTFEYEDLPVLIGPLEGDGITEYEFVVIDNQFNDCSNWTEIDPVNCGGEGECYISELVIDDHPCEEGMYYVYLNFDYENVGDEGFKLLVDWEFYGTYNYDDLPLNIGPFIGDGEKEYHFLVRDIETEDCASDANFGPILCEDNGCNIWDMEADVLPCNDSGYFQVSLNFEYENVGDEGFVVKGNGNNYGTFEYENLPVLIGPLAGDGITEYEFVAIDKQFEECSDWTAIDPVNCDGGAECNIWDLVVEPYPCEEGEFDVSLDFEYENVGDEGFKLLVNWDLYESYDYSDLPLTVGPFVGDDSTSYHFLVRDIQFENCAEDAAIDPVDCNGGECSIWDVEATVLPCNDDDEFEVLLTFEFEHVGEEGFTVRGNGINYGTFEYADLPIQLGPFLADGETEYEFEARDNQFEDCYDWTAIDPFLCDTTVVFSNMNMEITDCNGQTYYLVIDFDASNENENGFALRGNGMETQFFSYNDLPIKTGPLTNDEISSYYFIVTDNTQNHHGDWQRFFPFSCEGLGFDESHPLGNQLAVYPNPSRGIVHFKNRESSLLKLEIFDGTGKKVEAFVLNGAAVYSVEFENSGFYFYRLSDGTSIVGGKIAVE